MHVLAVLPFLRISHQNSVCTSTLPRTRYTFCPYHSPLLDCPSNISVSSTNSEVPHCALFSSLLLLTLLRTNYLPLYPVLRHPQPLFFLHVRYQISHP